MWSMILKRLFRGVLTLVIVVVLIFVLLRVVPGDPAAMLAGEDATPEQIAMIQERWGLNDPLPTQFITYVQSLISGDAGQSFMYSTTMGEAVWSVTDLVMNRLPYTIQLASVAICISIFIAIPIGIYTALHQGGIVDNTVTVVNFINLSFPVFFIGMIFMAIFALWLRILPVGGTEHWYSVLLPALTLSMHFNVTLMRMTRTEVGRNLTSDYIRMCRAKGLTNRQVLWVHSLRNAAIPLVTLIGLRFGAMLGGSVIVETLFRWPGIGNLLITAVQARDYPTVQFLIPYVALVFIIINIIVDVLYGIIDPRIHREA